jgi:hypothetical protein
MTMMMTTILRVIILHRLDGTTRLPRNVNRGVILRPKTIATLPLKSILHARVGQRVMPKI